MIIVGQDPYINGEAHGLAFSSQSGVTPSLDIIFRELKRCGYERTDTDLSSWARQGVLLLNSVLTTQRGLSLAHRDYGWQKFTGAVLRYAISQEQPIAILLWGKEAQSFYDDAMSYYTYETHHILTLRAVHPVAEHRQPQLYKFVGCNHFVEANQFLELHGQNTINWAL